MTRKDNSSNLVKNITSIVVFICLSSYVGYSGIKLILLIIDKAT